MRVLVITLINSLFFIGNMMAQGEPIVLQNPSFEDMPRTGKVPQGWYDCGFPTESAPDIQPSNTDTGAFFKVVKPAINGKTYVGMVVRDNNTWEMISQRLSQPVEAGKCYQFSISLARSEIYVSVSRTTNEEVNYTSPVKLRVWGGHGYCGKVELLGETPLVINSRWLEYNFKFEPKGTHSYILLEAFYKTPTLFPYNGNILIDNASPIYPIPCSTEVPDVPIDVPIAEDIAVMDQPVASSTSSSKNSAPLPKEKVVTTTSKPAPVKVLKDLDRNKIKTGQTIRIDKLYFLPDQTAPTKGSYTVLDEVYSFLAINTDMVVEIGGHTNTIPEHDYCDRLSTQRAKSVVDYLIRKGVASDRLQYKGYGKREPLIFDKNTKANRKRNQRVEIKVLSFDG